MKNIHYVLMNTLTKKDLQLSYTGLQNFIDVHNITPQQFDKCFGKHFYKRHPMFHNDRAINKLIKFLGINAKVKTVYPTDMARNTYVRFDLC